MVRRVMAVGILAFLFLGSQPAVAGVTEVIPFSAGHFSTNYKWMVAGGESRPVKVPIPFYLIRHSKQGLILFDSGLGSRFDAEVHGSWLNRLLQLPLPYELKPEETAVRQLAALGIPAEAIRTIVLSHLHLDHAGGLKDFPNATVIVSQKEWDHANVGRFLARLRGSIKEQYDGLGPRLGLVNYSPASLRGPFQGSYDLFGDGSLILLSTPGHTPGHQSLLVTEENGKQILLTGDAVWVKEGYERPAPKSWIVSHLEEKAGPAWQSTEAIYHFHQQHPEVTIVPGHDPESTATLSTASPNLSNLGLSRSGR